MAQFWKTVAVLVLLAALVGALTGTASVVRSLPATAADDPAGIVYTETLAVGRYWRTTEQTTSGHAEAATVQGSVHVDVRGAVDKLAMQSGYWDARLSCPTPVAKQGDETFERSRMALSAAASFAVSIATASHRGLHHHEYRCWLRVTIWLPEDGERNVIRDAMLPVRIVHAQHRPT